MERIDVKSSTYIDFEIKKVNAKIKKYKNIFAKVILQIDLKKLLWLKNLKALFCGDMLLAILTEKKSLEHLTKKNCKKQIKTSLELKKQ